MGINYNGCYLSLDRPLVMGIVNATPDSFYANSRRTGSVEVLRSIGKMLTDGASIIDIGAYSSRPSAEDVSAAEEIRRLDAVLADVVRTFPDAMLSVDTFRAEVARHVVENYGVGIINDISGCTLDDEMMETIAGLKVAYVLMHMRATPRDMQNYCHYNHLLSDVIDFLQKKADALHRSGVNDVIIDPGFGFAKTMEQNYEMMQHLDVFSVLNMPLLVGVSRKSMIYNLLGTSPEDALNGTTALHMHALHKGAKILRVHDVKEAVETIRIFEALNKY